MQNNLTKVVIGLVVVLVVVILGIWYAVGRPPADEVPVVEGEVDIEEEVEVEEEVGEVGVERETLTFGSTLGLAVDMPWWPTEFIVFLQDRLNINLEILVYTTDTKKLALASGDLPDLMMVMEAGPILEGRLAVPMDNYLDEFGPNIVSERFSFRNAMIREHLSMGDGKLYFHTPHTGPEGFLGAVEVWNGILVRWDLYKEIGAPEIRNDEDYIQVLKQMRELYPVTEGGDPVYAMGIHNDWGLWGWTFRGIANNGFANIGPTWSYILMV